LNGTPVFGSMVRSAAEVRMVESAFAATDTLSRLALLTRPLLLASTFSLRGALGRSRRWFRFEVILLLELEREGVN